MGMGGLINIVRATEPVVPKNALARWFKLRPPLQSLGIPVERRQSLFSNNHFPYISFALLDRGYSTQSSG